jgi:CRP/FNR family transcriptional regulator, dissimilatory nitrate respiration regulator
MIMIMQPPLSALFAGSRALDLPAGAPVFLNGQAVETVFMIVAGLVQLQRHTCHGARLILQNAGPGAVLAEASAYSAHYHCDAVVTEAASLAALPKPAFLAALRDDPELALTWSAMLARSVQAARVRAEIRSLPKVAERLDAWLAEGYTLPEKGRWQEVAAELGVTREALYRELSHRRTRRIEQ